jgi:hypothetical protein
MILVVLLIGAVLLVAALRNTYSALFADLGQDVPKFVTWAAAIVALGALGYLPGLRPISRGLMSLVLVVIVFQNYQNILEGFQSVAQANTPSQPQETKSTTPAASNVVTLDFQALDHMPPPSSFSSSEIGH